MHKCKMVPNWEGPNNFILISFSVDQAKDIMHHTSYTDYVYMYNQVLSLIGLAYGQIYIEGETHSPGI